MCCICVKESSFTLFSGCNLHMARGLSRAHHALSYREGKVPLQAVTAALLPHRRW